MADELEYGLKETAETAGLVELSEAINVVLERCARLVESSKDAHDLHEIAATIRGWKQ